MTLCAAKAKARTMKDQVGVWSEQASGVLLSLSKALIVFHLCV